jgi:hypothetical protein
MKVLCSLIYISRLFLLTWRFGLQLISFCETVVAGLKQEWDNCWTSLETICLNAAELGHVLKYGTKNRKRRAFTDLLKTLEACGLSKHRLVNTVVFLRVLFLFAFLNLSLPA